MCRPRRWTARLLLLIITTFYSLACGGRPAKELDAAVDLPWWSGDANVEGWVDDAGRICSTSPSSVISHRDPRGNYQITISPGSQVVNAQLGRVDAADSATAVDMQTVAGLVLSHKIGPQTAVVAVETMREAVRAHPFFHSLQLRASGVNGKSCEGDPDVKEAVWELRTNDESNPRQVRNMLAGIGLGRKTALDLPDSPPSGNRFVAKLTFVVREQTQLVLSAAVASGAEYDAAGGLGLVDDLGNGTAVARVTTALGPVCDEAMATGQGSADIIWVIDESASMDDNREAIIRNTNAFFAKATAAGLDFRMGVTGMKNPNDTGIPGKFCSRASSHSDDDGGADRFLIPKEKAVFDACIRNPPYYEPGDEYGLAGIYQAIVRHLPRAENDPTKIRKAAELVVIIVTDEAPHELKPRGHYQGLDGFLRLDEYTSSACFLAPESRDRLDNYLEPWMRLLKGESDPEGRAIVHLLGGVCGNRCDAQFAHGYVDLARELGGHVGDICQNDIGATLQVIIDSIVAVSSPRILTRRPISASLSVSVDGRALHRGREGGFTYDASKNAISFFDVKLGVGSQIIASFLSYDET